VTIDTKLIDQLLTNYKKPEDIIGENGLLKELTKAFMERALRAVLPTPWAEMSAETAAEIGAADGTEVWVKTKSGRARFVTKVVEMRAGVVSVEYGWWFPEEASENSSLESIWISNANVLTNADFESCDPLLGQWSYNGLQCRVYPVRKNDQTIFQKQPTAHEMQAEQL
jgi:predicted molibdopterin-dependent oxidoreductase YjgC